MRATKRGAVARVGGREGGSILEGGETYASAGGHGDGNAPYHKDGGRGLSVDASREFMIGLTIH